MIPDSLSNKTILLISPQAWGKMFLTKHHYAIELSQMGNDVFFLNPPDNVKWSWQKAEKRIAIQSSEKYANLYLIRNQLFFPYLLKFHARWLFDILMERHIADIKRIVGKKIDIVWSFDHSNIFPLQFFNESYRVLHLVDEPNHHQVYKAVKHANVLFAVTREILSKFEKFALPCLQINHGVAQVFLDNAGGTAVTRESPIDVGLSGNWLRPDLDHACLMEIIADNPNICFNFFGAYQLADTNIGGGHESHNSFISGLRQFSNVRLHGALPFTELATKLKSMDMFLICYNVQKDQSSGTNYHKIMEYLSTGKVIVSNNVSAYAAQPELLQMVSDRTSNKDLPSLFREVAANLEFYNSNALMEIRKSYARNNTYRLQIAKMENFIRNKG